MTRVAILYNPDAGPATWFNSATAAAPKFAVTVVSAPVRDATEIETAIAQWGREPNVGLIVVPDPATNAHRKLINELATRYRLPVIHPLRAAAAEGGLISYGVDLPKRVPTGGSICRSHYQGGQPRRPADLPADQV